MLSKARKGTLVYEKMVAIYVLLCYNRYVVKKTRMWITALGA
ncbi:hypothetical protein lbkm_1639 [Lachnospiraceae bacterium KM106-2]|nr:hypothetical protein lbkm_1639 [Lachnospiraceae bacterium KM106-2]